MSRKILILVLSYTEPPYDSLMHAQIDTWDSIGKEGVKTLYYHGGPEQSIHHKIIGQGHKSSSHVLQLPCTDSYYYMSHKLKLALQYVKDWDCDLIFRTNSSSYVNKEELLKLAETLPLEKCYAGWEIKGNEGFNIVSGAGFFISRDCAEILMNEIDPEFEKEEDYYCASILHKHGIPIIDDKSRVDVDHILPYNDIPLNRYHYRFKGVHGDRLQDANNMRKIHQLIINK